MDYILPNEYIRWSLVVVVYMFLAGVGAGSLIVAVLPRLPWLFDAPSLLRLRRAAIITAAACFVVVPLAVIADLGQPWRMWRVLLAPHWVSAMPWGSYALLVLLALIVINLWMIHQPYMARVARDRNDWLGSVYRVLTFGVTNTDTTAIGKAWHMAIAIASVVAAIIFVAYTGFLLSTMTSFGLWYTPLLGIIFAIAALASGFAWLSVVAGASPRLTKTPGLIKLLAGSTLTFVLIHAGVRLWDLFHAAYVENILWPAVRVLLFERYFVSFVVVELIVGVGVAGLLLLVAVRTGNRLASLAGGSLALLGLFASRWVIIMGGQSISRTGEGFVPYTLKVFGREGILAGTGLVFWALVIGYALWTFLPWQSQDEETDSEVSPDTSKGYTLALSRRHALGIFLGAGAAFATGYATLRTLLFPHYTRHTPGPTPPQADGVINTICLSCDARCGSRAIIRDGRVRNHFGNPYNPTSTLNRPIPLDTSLEASFRTSGSLCLKGVSGLQYLYDPYRIKLPLKRTGPRGSGQFQVIGWDQLIEEVTEGGQLFAIGEERDVEGLRAIRNFDPIDPEQPELGPQAYGLVWNTGRGQSGRQQFIQRFLTAFGSKNYVSHTDLCQMNWYVANYLFTGRYNPGHGLNRDVRPGTPPAVSGATNQLFGDIVNARYLLLLGVNLGAGWKPGVNTSGPILANRHARGEVKIVLVDPYVAHGARYTDEWVPIKPGTDAAMLMGMMRWIIDNERFDRQYLENPSRAAAEADDETTWVNGTYLVVWNEDDPRHRTFLRGSDLNMGEDEFIVIDAETGEIATHTASDAGELFVDQTILGPEDDPIRVKSSLQLLRDEIDARSIDEWAEICGVPTETITRLAEEFTSYGKQAAVSTYRGATMHSYGIYAGLAVNIMNALIGNYNWKGGMIRHASGPAWDEGLFDVNRVEDAPSVKGVHISRISGRSDIAYEESSEYARKVAAGENPYPPTRPWYPITHAGITTEALAAADTGYPYGVKCYINYFVNQTKSIPGGERYIETLQDVEKIPLLISVDTTISETSIYSDYIVPDAMYLDGHYNFMAQQAGACSAPHQAIRHPAVAPLTGRTDDGRPMMMDTFLIDVAKRLGLPGYGEDAIVGSGPYEGQRFPLHKAEDYYLRAIANIAHNAGTPEASTGERDYVERTCYVAQFRDLLTPEEWSRSAYLLGRGGYFTDPEEAWDQKGRLVPGIRLDERAPFQIWHESLATIRESMTGRLLHGTATYHPAEDGIGRSLEEIDAEYPFRVVTFRLATRTKARTAYDYWAIETHPVNYIEMNPQDTDSMGILSGDLVRISSPSGSAEGVVKVSHRVMPGTLAGTHHFAHTQQGNSDWIIEGAAEAVTGGSFVSRTLHGMSEPVVEGNRVRGDKRRASKGFNVNRAMRRNDANVLAGTPLVDNAGGATVFLDSRVRVDLLRQGTGDPALRSRIPEPTPLPQ
ncbi:MAG: NrfD/PsrC family molybdoenzyme membrane anchor subunit [Trueperaceae bacterium]|nr:NrfD/PsrC family molybdoenzyme membrane anchor subunit [Trueperaceae bacterium]